MSFLFHSLEDFIDFRFYIKLFKGWQAISFLIPKSSFLLSKQSILVLCLQYLCLLALLLFQVFSAVCQIISGYLFAIIFDTCVFVLFFLFHVESFPQMTLAIFFFSKSSFRGTWLPSWWNMRFLVSGL